MNNLTRRQFAALSVASLAGLVVAGRASGRQPAASSGKTSGDTFTYFDWKKLADNVWAGLPREGYPFSGGNTLLVVGAAAVLLSDTKFTALGPELAAEAAAIAGRRPTIVFNTHHHMDHTAGNNSFADARLISQELAKPRIEGQVANYAKGIEGNIGEIAKLNKPETEPTLNRAKEMLDKAPSFKAADFTPRETFKDELALDVGGIKVSAQHVGPGHTDNDAFLFLPQQNVMHTGDLLFNKLHPFIDGKAGASTTGWQNSLKVMIALCNDKTIVVPGHGAIADKSALQAQYDYWDKLRTAVKHAKDVESMTRDEVMKLKPGGFDGYGFDQMLPNALGVLFDELSKN